MDVPNILGIGRLSNGLEKKIFMWSKLHTSEYKLGILGVLSVKLDKSDAMLIALNARARPATG